MQLTGNTILITGSTSGIGRALAESYGLARYDLDLEQATVRPSVNSA